MRAHNLSTHHFVRNGIESFFRLTNKFWRTLKTLLLKPGELSVDFVNGNKSRFVKPFPLFLAINILLILSPSNPYSLPLYNYLTQENFTNFNTKEIVNKKLNTSKISITEFTADFNQTIKQESKFFIFLYIPFYAFFFFILFWSREKKLTDHLVFSTHFISFYLLFYNLAYLLMVIPFYFFAETGLYPLFNDAFAAFFIISISIYLFFALRKFYNTSIFMSVFCSLTFCFSYVFLMQFYRMLLFYKIMKFNL